MSVKLIPIYANRQTLKISYVRHAPCIVSLLLVCGSRLLTLHIGTYRYTVVTLIITGLGLLAPRVDTNVSYSANALA